MTACDTFREIGRQDDFERYMRDHARIGLHALSCEHFGRQAALAAAEHANPAQVPISEEQQKASAGVPLPIGGWLVLMV